MNKIEDRIRYAIATRTSFKKGYDEVVATGEVFIACHLGNVYATGHYTPGGDPPWTVRVCADALRDYGTETMCSRLRALGIPASLHNGQPMLNGHVLDWMSS